MDWWNLQIPAPVALAVVATIGYLICRQRHWDLTDAGIRSRRELKRAQSVAAELDKIAWTIRQSLSRHHASVARFKQQVNRLSEHEQDIAWKDLCREAEDILAPTLQLATQIASAYDEIRQQSANLMMFTEVRIDPLTRVSNRRGLDDAVKSQLAMLTRYHSAFSIALFDIDHFKKVNDEEGHVHGDQILKELAQLFDESVRQTDLIARYGGEEFVVVMPHTDVAGANIFAERLRAKVETRLRVTISGGVAQAQPGDTQEELVARADAALYSAKSDGRNCVFFHTGAGTERVLGEAVQNASL